MCGCNSSSTGSTSVSTNSSEYITIDVLQTFRRPLVCVRDNNLHAAAGFTVEELDTLIQKVDTYIAILISINSNPTYADYYPELLAAAMKAIEIPQCL